MKKLLAVVALIICAVMGMTALAETAEVIQPFTEGTIDVDGTLYRLRKRLSSTLFICTEQIDSVATPGFMGILTTEDNEKTISVIYLDPRMCAEAEDGAEKITLSQTFVDTLAENDARVAGEAVLAAVNGLIGEDLVEDYIVFDVAGLDIIEGLPEVDVTGLEPMDSMKARLKNAKHYAETLSSDAVTDLIGDMSDYLATEMKSGALVKIADKAERYIINPSIHLEIELMPEEEDVEYLPVATDVLYDILFDIFYEVNPY